MIYKFTVFVNVMSPNYDKMTLKRLKISIEKKKITKVQIFIQMLILANF